jgi:membrane-associated phospholipid phosphatase
MLLTVHWLTDVVAGLALGWGWCAVCAAALGRTLFAPAGRVATAARAGSAPPPGKMCR